MKSKNFYETLYAQRALYPPDTPDELEDDEDTIDFTFGHPDPVFFPVPGLQEAINNVINSSVASALQYSNFRGSEILLENICTYLLRKYRTNVAPKKVIITNGSMQVIGLTAKIFIEPRDIVLVEAPTYFRAVTIFRNHEANILEVPVDQEGLCIDKAEDLLKDLEKQGKRPKLFYTVPTHQNPTGATLPLDRRLQLLELSLKYGFIILEDSAYNDLWYDQTPPKTLYELDEGFGRVIQMGTFSKLIAPGLSIGWAIGPEDIVNRFVEFKENGGTTPFTAHIAAEFIGGKSFENHIIELRKIYKHKRDIMISSLNTHISGLMGWNVPLGGYFVWLSVNDSIDMETLWKNAVNEKVVYLPGKYCFASSKYNRSSYVRLAFSNLSAERIEEGIKRLGIVIKKTF